MSLAFDPNDLESQEDKKQLLYRLDGGQLNVLVASGHPHCDIIERLYKVYLSPWFARVLKPDEQRELSKLFLRMLSNDRYMIASLERLAYGLTEEARVVLDLVNENKLVEANLRVRAARKQVRPLRDLTYKTMIRLYQLQDEFVANE